MQISYSSDFHVYQHAVCRIWAAKKSATDWRDLLNTTPDGNRDEVMTAHSPIRRVEAYPASVGDIDIRAAKAKLKKS